MGVPVGGAGQLTEAVVNRARAAGAHIECGREVDAIEVSGAAAPWPSGPLTGRPRASAARDRRHLGAQFVRSSAARTRRAGCSGPWTEAFRLGHTGSED